MYSDRGRQRVQDRRVPIKEEVSGGIVPGSKDYRNQSGILSPTEIARAVADFVQIDINVLLGYSRSKSLVKWRHLTYLIAYELTGHSLTELGDRFNRDHTSILNGKRNARRLLENPEFFSHYQAIKALF